MRPRPQSWSEIPPTGPATAGTGRLLADPTIWLTLAFAALFLAQSLHSSLTTSLTFDEPTFITAGCSSLARNDFRLVREAPPLMVEAAAALPTLLLHPKLPGTDEATWQEEDYVTITQEFLRLNAARVPRIAGWARLPNQLLGVALLLAMAWWGRRLLGRWPAVAGVAAAAFCPELLAHASLATTDFGCAAFMFLAVAAFWKAVEEPKPLHWIGCGALTGLALMAKYTSLLLGPIYLVLVIALLLRRRIGIVPLLQGLAWGGVTMLVVMGAAYNFTFNLPLYVRGFTEIYARGRPGYQFYLCGEVYNQPRWYYHPAAFLMKTPLPLLTLLVVAAVAALRKARRGDAILFLLVPALLVIGASCLDRSNIGLRRILPAFPFLALFAGQARAGAASRRRTYLVAALLGWLAIEALAFGPHYLSYFNEAVGGPTRGPYLLDDSNVDWGQDLPWLARWQRAHPEARPFRAMCFGNVPADIYGVTPDTLTVGEVTNPPPGWYAVSAHYLAGFRKLHDTLGPEGDWLTRFKPCARAGYSIYIYRFPQR